MSRPEPKSIVVDVDQVDEDPDNARLTFDQAELKILGESLKGRQLYAIQVRKLNNGRYQLVDGARRLRAAKLAGIKQLRADDLGGHIDAKTAAILAATANLEREDLTPYEEARAFQRLLDQKVTKKEITETFGVPFNTLQSRLELLELPEAVAKRIGDARGADGTVFGLGHAKALVPLAKHPKLLEAALAGFDKQLPEAKQAHNTVVQVLQNADLIADPQDAFGWSWQSNYKTTAAAVKKLDAVKLVEYGNEKQFVVDVAGFKTVVAEHHARETAHVAKEKAAAAKEKAAAKVDPVKAKALAEKERKARELEAAAEPVLSRLKGKAAAANLQSAARRATVAWDCLVEHMSNGDWTSSTYAPHVLGIAEALKIDEAEVRATFKHWLADDDGAYNTHKAPTTAPAWFTKLKGDQQYHFVAAVLAADRVLYSHHSDTKEYTGRGIAELKAEATRIVKEEQAAKDKAAAVKLAHGDKKPKKGGGAPPASPKKAAPAPKANGKAKAAKPAKETPAVAKARAKLAKGKQAVLMAAAPTPAVTAIRDALAEALPDGNGPPAISPREMADKVLADVLPGLKAVKQAAQDNGIQA